MSPKTVTDILVTKPAVSVGGSARFGSARLLTRIRRPEVTAVLSFRRDGSEGWRGPAGGLQACPGRAFRGFVAAP